MLRLPPRPTLFPYTTLFRSVGAHPRGRRRTFRRRTSRFPERRQPRPVFRLRDTESGTARATRPGGDRKSTRLNSSHVKISYAVFCLKKKKKKKHDIIYNINS